MLELARLELLLKSQKLYLSTGDSEHLRDVERILEYDGLAEIEE